ncbi:MAG: DUF4349 domain-containing protein [Syntrophomonas sp.]
MQDVNVFSRLVKKNRIITMLLFIGLIFSLPNLVGCGSKSSLEIQEEVRSQSQISRNSAADLGSAEQANQPLESISLDRKIVQNANLKLRVQDVAAATDQIIGLCNQNGGYTVNSHIYRDEERVYADLSLKVPQPELTSIISSISQYGEITDKVISTQDVTEEYYDSEARLKVMKSKEERLLSLMDKTANITEIISVENELSKTRSEIEVLTGRLQYLSNATDFSLVRIDLEQGVPGAIKAPQGTLGKAAQGLITSLNHLINFASDTVVFLFVILPWAVVLAILFVLFRYIYKKIKPRSPQE